MTEPTGRMAAELLIQTGCVRFQFNERFRYASGILSPMYCDCRRLLSTPNARRLIVDTLTRRVDEFWRSLDAGQGCTLVAAVATAAIPYGAMVAERLDLPLVYVRSDAKSHGTRQRIEGAVEAPGETVVIEDTITTGRSAVAAVVALKEAGATVRCCLSIVDYGFKMTSAAFGHQGVPAMSLTDFHAIADISVQRGLITGPEHDALRTWWDEVNAAGVDTTS